MYMYINIYGNVQLEDDVARARKIERFLSQPFFVVRMNIDTHIYI